MNNQKSLRELMVKYFKNKEFLIVKKYIKIAKIYKLLKCSSFLILISSLIPQLSDIKTLLSVVGVSGVLFFDDKILKSRELLNKKDNLINQGYRNQLNSMEIAEFRINNLNDLKLNKISKEDYITLIEEELELIYFLIKDDCYRELKVNLNVYKNDIEHINEIINIALSGNFITKEEVKLINKKWKFNMQSLCNHYSKTDLEDDLKYLQLCIKQK